VTRTPCMLGVLGATFVIMAVGEQPMIEGKPDLSGAWQIETSTAGDQVPQWSIDQTLDKIHIKESLELGKVTTDVECGTKAVECPGRVDGKDASVVFYFNGPILVQITRKGKEVTKVRRTLSDDGQKITMEVIPYVPAGDPKTVVLVRAAGQPQQQSSAKVQ
jgi:hypothetical protein